MKVIPEMRGADQIRYTGHYKKMEILEIMK